MDLVSYCKVLEDLRMKNKKFKYEISETGQFIEIPCSYKVMEKKYFIKEFILTQELLDESKLPLKKFISYLMGELDKKDKYFYLCQEIFVFNGPVKTSSIKDPKILNYSNENLISKVIEITTAKGKIIQ